MRIGENLLVATCRPSESTWRSVLEAIGSAVVSQKGYSRRLIGLGLDQALSAPEQPRHYGRDIVAFHARIMGVEEALVVAAVLEALPDSSTNLLPRHILLYVSSPVPSRADLRRAARLSMCLELPRVAARLGETRSSHDFAVAIQEAFRSQLPESLTPIQPAGVSRRRVR